MAFLTQLGIVQLWEVGFFQAPFAIGEPIFFFFWAALLIAFAVQLLLLKTCRRFWSKWSFLILSLAGALLGEILCQVITGWDKLAALLLYGLFLAFLLGAGLARACFHRKKQRKER